MHPLGGQFGVSRGLLQLRGEQVLLSDQLVEAISLEAQARVALGKPPIDGNFLVDMTVRAAENALENQHQGSRQEMVPFFTHLNRTMYYTLCRVAERAGLAHKEPRRLFLMENLCRPDSFQHKKEPRRIVPISCIPHGVH